METTGKRVDSIDILRGIAILFMILGHSFIVYPVNVTNNPVIMEMHTFIYAFHMELFFFLAGSVYKCNDYKRYIVKKAKRLLIPYCVFGGLSLLLHTYGGNLINGRTSLKESLIDFFLYGGEYWFLYTLMLIYAVFPVFEKIAKNRRWLYGCIIAICFACCYFKFHTPLFRIESILYYFPYFIIGFLLSGILKSGWAEEAGVHKKILALLADCACFVITAVLERKTEPLFAFAYLKAFSLIAFFTALVYLLFSAKAKNGTAKRFLISCGRYSLRFYMLDGYLLTIARYLVCKTLSIKNEYLIVTLLFLTIVFVSYALCRYIIDKSKLLQTVFGG